MRYSTPLPACGFVGRCGYGVRVSAGVRRTRRGCRIGLRGSRGCAADSSRAGSFLQTQTATPPPAGPEERGGSEEGRRTPGETRGPPAVANHETRRCSHATCQPISCDRPWWGWRALFSGWGTGRRPTGEGSRRRPSYRTGYAPPGDDVPSGGRRHGGNSARPSAEALAIPP